MKLKSLFLSSILIANLLIVPTALAQQDCPPNAVPNNTVCKPATWFISYGDNSFRGVLTIFIQILFALAGLVSIAYVIYGGFQYITSRGDEEQAAAGKRTVSNAIIGLVIIILAYTIISVVVNALRGKVA